MKRIADSIITMIIMAPATCLGVAPGQVYEQPDGSLTRYVHIIPLFPEDKDGYQGRKITPDQPYPQPFSTRWSCGACHDYELITQGFHFNSTDPNTDPGRIAQPWIYVDPLLVTQIPLSYRAWPGTYMPSQIGLDQFEFLIIFGRHMPGAGPGEQYSNDPCLASKAFVSGSLQANCLACHLAGPGPNMGGPMGYADHLQRGNFRWAITACWPFATVKGSIRDAPAGYDPYNANVPNLADPNTPPPLVWYNKAVFDDYNFVTLDLTKAIPSERCYFCHSNVLVARPQGQRLLGTIDLHVARGLQCVDCHRHGLDHKMVRGFEGQFVDPNQGWAAAFTCRGCHMPTQDGPVANIKGPYPQHKGLPTFHLDRLACTACHSGPTPSTNASLVKTSRAHALGTTTSTKSDLALPHIIYPVYATGPDGKIGPYKLIWPAFWAVVSQDGQLRPADLDLVGPMVMRVIKRSMVPADGSWPVISEQMIAKILQIIAKEAGLKGRPGYIACGRLHMLDDSDNLISQEHPAARPFMWAAAHDVRPARTALGANGCMDCHNNGSPLFFGSIPVDGPLSQKDRLMTADLMDVDIQKIRVLNRAFMLRSTLKTVVISCLGLCALLVLTFLVMGLFRCTKWLAEMTEDNKD